MHQKQQREALLNAAAVVDALPSAMLSLEISKEKGAPAEFRIFKEGENDSTQGKFLFSKRSAELVMQLAKDWGNKFHVDWDHHSAQTRQGVQARAACWHSLELRNGELWATKCSWTPKGKEDIEGEYYKYISPWFTYDSKTREITAYTNAGLTNLPSLKMLEALASIPGAGAGTQQPPPNDEVTDMERKALLSALGLPESATDVEMNSKLAELNAFKKQTMVATGAKSDFEAMQALLSIQNNQAEVTLLKAKLEQQTKDSVTKERDALLSQAVEQGKLEPGGELKKQLEAQPVEMVKAILAQLPAKTTGTKEPPKGTEKNTTTGGSATALLSKEQDAGIKKVAGWFEHDPAKVKEHFEKMLTQQAEAQGEQ